MNKHIDLLTGTVTVERSPDAVGRTLHLVDIENLSGGPAAPRHHHVDAWRQYERRAELRAEDHVIIAACERVMSGLMFELPSYVSKHIARGADGADRMLLEAGDPVWVASRFGRVVIGSGDHAFAPFGRTVQGLGTSVVVVSGVGHRSKDLVGEGFGVRAIDLWVPQDELGLIV